MLNKTLNHTESYCLYIDPDSGNAFMDRLSKTPVEKVPVRGYTTSIIGSKSKIESMLRRIERKPYLVEKYINNFR